MSSPSSFKKWLYGSLEIFQVSWKKKGKSLSSDEEDNKYMKNE